ncbi:anaphase-promoting complex subunit 5-domain-containing protein [Hyaloraphidium curvatum]|nr:anaphase-promoting complex subunit 5-domain-containing protein [Hyaloraphidium curvatum]
MEPHALPSPPQASPLPPVVDVLDAHMDEDGDGDGDFRDSLLPGGPSSRFVEPLPASRYVTPNKVCLLALIDSWCKRSEAYGTAGSDALLAFVTWSIEERKRTLGEPTFGDLCRRTRLLPDDLGELIVADLIEHTAGIDSLDAFLDFFAAASRLLGPVDPTSSVRKIDGTSVLGVFLRQCCLDFNTMAFDRVVSFYESFRHYVMEPGGEWQEGVTNGVAEQMEGLSFHRAAPATPGRSNRLSGERLPTPSATNRELLGIVSDHDLHNWIQGQISRIEIMAGRPLPLSVRSALRKLQSQMADLDEYNCLLFVDAMERGEYVVAVDSLRRFFDRTILLDAPVDSEDVSPKEPQPRYQYALLHLASVHAAFGYTNEAITALLECQDIARENHDAACLKFCRLWMQNLQSQGDRSGTGRNAILGTLAESSRKGGLSYLQALAELTIARQALQEGKPPGSFFAAYTRANAIISRPERRLESPEDGELLRSLRAPAQLLLVTAYRRYGFANLARTLDAMSNELKESCDAATWSRIVADRAQDLVSFSGKWKEADRLVHGQMGEAKGHFVAEAELRQFWDLVCFERSLRRKEASKLSLLRAQLLSSSGQRSGEPEDPDRVLEVQMVVAEYLLSIDKVPEAFSLLCETLSHPACTGPSSVAFLLKLADLHVTRSSSPLTALPLILRSLTLSSQFHMASDQLIAALKLAGILLNFQGLSQRSLRLCEQAIPTVLADGTLVARGEAWVTHARCLIACAGDLLDSEQQDRRTELLESAIESLDHAREAYEAFEAVDGVQTALYYKSRVFDILGRTEERNAAAAQFMATTATTRS